MLLGIIFYHGLNRDNVEVLVSERLLDIGEVVTHLGHLLAPVNHGGGHSEDPGTDIVGHHAAVAVTAAVALTIGDANARVPTTETEVTGGVGYGGPRLPSEQPRPRSAST